MYKDKEIIKEKEIELDEKVNVKMGMKLIRNQKDKGKEFDIEGKGIERKDSMVEEMRIEKKIDEKEERRKE